MPFSLQMLRSIFTRRGRTDITDDDDGEGDDVCETLQPLSAALLLSPSHLSVDTT